VRCLPKGVIVLLALGAVTASQFATVPWTNFGGVDEWLYLSLNSRGIVSFPHSNRPLTLLWSLPGFLLTPDRFAGYLAMHVLYLLLGAWLTWQIVRRVEPAAGPVAFLAGVFALVWAPLDMARLAAVQTSMNSGATFATLLSIALLVESWRRGRWALLGLGLALAFLAARSYEATLGLLAGAPLLLAAATPDPRGARPGRLRLCLAWEAGALLLGALAARPFLERGAGAVYQTAVLGADLHPGHWLARMARLFLLHIGPLVPADPSELLRPGVAAAVVVFLGAAAAAGLARPDPAPWCSRQRLAGLAATGLCLAGMGYAVLALSPGIVNATRTQFLSAPGIGLFLAATLGLVASLMPARARNPLLLAAAAAVVAVGTGHTLAMQREWDRTSAYPAQREALVAMVREAPSLPSGTLVLLLDEDRAFPYTLTFRHAVGLVYGPGVVGHVVGGDPLLYSIGLAPGGFQVLPWPVVRGPWREGPTLHRSEEVVAFRLSGGRLRLVERWEDSGLPALETGARYAPRERIGGPPRPAPKGRRALD
jgi:hypothetical protein